MECVCKCEIIFIYEQAFCLQKLTVAKLSIKVKEQVAAVQEQSFAFSNFPITSKGRENKCVVCVVQKLKLSCNNANYYSTKRKCVYVCVQGCVLSPLLTLIFGGKTR